LSKVGVAWHHSWQISINFITINSKVWDESFVLLAMTYFELVVEALGVQHVFKVSSLLNMVLALLLEYDGSIG
jgi:hypothetical protein